MSLFRRKSGAVVEAIPATAADPLAEAHHAMKEAEAAAKAAKDALNFYETHSRTFGPKTLPNGTVGFQLDEDPERLRLSLIAARLHDQFQAATRRWSELDRQVHPETIWVAGIRVSP
jgi:hypothetical protein